MKRINKILVLFLFVISVAMFAIWEILQSRVVASQISSIATNYLEQVLDAKIEFENLQFSLLPPGAEVKNLQINGKKNNVKFKARANSFGAYFNPFDIFETKFTVDKLLLEDGEIEISYKKTEGNETKTEKNNENPLKHFNLSSILSALPINEIEIQDTSVRFNDYSIMGSKLSLLNRDLKLGVRGKIQQFELGKENILGSHLDSVELNFVLENSVLEVLELKVRSGVGIFSSEGYIKNYTSSQPFYSLKGNTKIPINMIHEWVDLEKIGKLESGLLDATFKVNGQSSVYNLNAHLTLENFLTDFAYGEKAELELNANSSRIVFRKFKLINKKEKLELVKPFEFFNMETKKFVEEPIWAKADSLETKNFLRYLRNNVSLLEGNLSGTFRFDLYPEKFSFQLQSDTLINNFAINPGEFELFNISNIGVTSGTFVIDQGKFNFNMELLKNKTKLNMDGEIFENNLTVNIPTSFVDLSDFNHILDYKTEGEGTLDIRMSKSKNTEFVIGLDSDLKKFSLDGYGLDKIKTSTDIYLDQKKIHVKKLYGSSNKSLIDFKGHYNIANQEMVFLYDIKNFNFSQLKRVLRPKLGDVKLSSNELHGTWDSNGTLKGKATSKGFVIDGAFTAKNNFIFYENFEKIKGNYTVQNGKVNVDRIVAKRGKGFVNLDVNYDIFTDRLEYNAKLLRLGIQDFNYYSKFPISLRADAYGYIKGSYQNNKHEIDLDVVLRNSRVFSQLYKNSNIKLKISEEIFFADINLFERQVYFNTLYSLNDQKSSALNIEIKSDNLRKILGVFSGVDLINTKISGGVDFTFNSEFNSTNLKFYNINSNLKKLILNKDPIRVDYSNSNPEIIVKNGEIIKWNVNARGKGFYIISSGKGNVLKKYRTESFLKVDASLIEVFNNFINRASGNLRGKLVYGNQNGKDDYEAYLTSNNLFLNSNLLPTSMTKTDMRLSFRKNQLNLERFYANLVNGTLSAKGIVDFGKIIPNINMKFQLNDAGFVILKKSNLTLSGEGSIIGSNFPYTIGGDFNIERFNLVNELTDFGFSDGSFSGGDIEYLPGKSLSLNDQILNFNLNIKTRNPINVRNSLADVGFVGNIQILGGEKEPKINGKVSLASRNNKVTFKNNEFVFSKGNITFSELESYSNPELDFYANSQISDYKVGVSLVGPVKNFNLALVSEPSLSQSDILSLIAFGYTEDLSNNLSDAEKESMTRAGVGSIIFDSFKINETLKNEFGIQVNLGTEISQDESSYLAGRSSEGGGGVGRVRSATTFEVKKKIDEKTTMSVRSTVGASSTQRQAINLNYNLNNSVSIEGVYESRSIDDQESINTNNSVGADVKWKWSFK